MRVQNSLADLAVPFRKRFMFNRLYQLASSRNVCDKSIIAIVGARRTGKTVLLMQLIKELLDNKVYTEENIEYYTYELKKLRNRQLENTRDTVAELTQFITQRKQNNPSLRVLVIDEISMCYDFCIAGGTLANYCGTNGIKLIVSGTYSSVIRESISDTCMDRVSLIDSTYISYSEYSYLNDLSTLTVEDKKVAVNLYLTKGSTLGGSLNAEEYLTSTVATNVAISLLTLDEIHSLQSINLEDINQVNEVIEVILKYYKYLSTSMTLTELYRAIRTDELSKSLSNLRTKLSKLKKREIFNDAIKEQFSGFQLLFNDCKYVYQDLELIRAIDEALSRLNLVCGEYEITDEADAVIQNLTLLHSFKMDTVQALMNSTILNTTTGLNPQDLAILKENIRQTTLGVTLEEVIVINTLDTLRLEEVLEEQQFSDGYTIKVKRRISPDLYKLRFFSKVARCYKEIDMITVDGFNINLYEIKHSTEMNVNQYKWLEDSEVEELLKNYFSDKISIKRFVLYMGEPREIETTLKLWIRNPEEKLIPQDSQTEISITYKNISDYLTSLKKNKTDLTGWYINGITTY
jgi:predicted AAA+ superfamily ATPase